MNPFQELALARFAENRVDKVQDTQREQRKTLAALQRARCMIAVIIAVGLPLIAHARLGETEQESILRYGQPQKVVVEGDPNSSDPKKEYRKLAFIKDGYVIWTTFYQGRTVSLEVEKTDQTAIGFDEMVKLMEINVQARKWHVFNLKDAALDNHGALDPRTLMEPEFETEDKYAFGKYFFDSCMFGIVDNQWYKRTEAEDKALRNKNEEATKAGEAKAIEGL